jgi:hypothetical protein
MQVELLPDSCSLLRISCQPDLSEPDFLSESRMKRIMRFRRFSSDILSSEPEFLELKNHRNYLVSHQFTFSVKSY